MTDKIGLSRTDWNELVEYLVDVEAIGYAAHARSSFLGPDQTRPCIAFSIDSTTAALLKLGAGLANAFRDLSPLVELAADGYGVVELLSDARYANDDTTDVVYFPGNSAYSF